MNFSCTDLYQLFLIYLGMGFTVGLGHCIGMCGPITVAIAMGRQKKGVLLPLLYYHMGRISTYMVLGGIMGAAGSFTRVAEWLLGWQHVILVGTGVMVCCMGLAMTGLFPKIRFMREDYAGGGWVAKIAARLIKREQTLAYFPVGLLLGFLPCGPVYVALTAAAGAGMNANTAVSGVVSGMGIMACFGIGTVPALFVLGRVSALKMISSRIFIYRIAGGLVILSGFYFISRGLF